MVFRPSMLAPPPEASADAPADAGAEAAVDAPAVGADELPVDEHAANTKPATTRRPAIRVTLRWVDNIRPPVAYVIVRFEDCRGPPSPGRAIGLIRRQCGGRRRV